MDPLNKQIKLYMLYSILGDIERTGARLWKINRKRVNDIKNHTFDLLLLAHMIREQIDYPFQNEKMDHYILVHDLPEAITGDITAFEGISKEERMRVKEEAIHYIKNTYGDFFNLRNAISDYEAQVDIESKFVHMLDKMHSALEFIQYESEKEIELENPNITLYLSALPLIVEAKNRGESVSEIFYHYHRKSIVITDEECQKYHITQEEAKRITTPILSFFDAFYKQKEKGTLQKNNQDFPKSASLYKGRPL